MLKSEQELPSVSSETFYETHHSMYKSKINEENKVLAAHGNREADKTPPSFAQQSILDQGTNMTGIATAAGDDEVPVVN
ncbi:hypothetical protein P5673_015772 [Acropora cervicornis]|uniref:Uncharacterized protein n=1 Tax=Acropora cervicornis TaxID=6130 RepID=A0AAD9V4T7_ACRCE|nr:hypothetical protein P5673_015772 [Acropora cervicornis]